MEIRCPGERCLLGVWASSRGGDFVLYRDYLSTNWTSGKNVLSKAGFPPGRALYLNAALPELPQRKEKTGVRPCKAGESKGLS